MPIEQVNVNKPSAFFRCVHVLHSRRVQDEFPSEECVRYVAISGREYLGCGVTHRLIGHSMQNASKQLFGIRTNNSKKQQLPANCIPKPLDYLHDRRLVGGLEQFFFLNIYWEFMGISSSQLTNSYFWEGRSTINQLFRHGRITREERWSMGPREFEGLTGLWSSGATSNLQRWSPVSCNQAVLDHTSIPGVWRSGLYIAAYKAAMILPFDPFFT